MNKDETYFRELDQKSGSSAPPLALAPAPPIVHSLEEYLHLAKKMAAMLRSLEVCCEWKVEFCPSCNVCFTDDCDQHDDDDGCSSDNEHADSCKLRALLDDVDKLYPLEVGTNA